MHTLEDIQVWITKAFEEVNLQLPKDRRVKVSSGTVLFGPKSVLDSLGLVNFIVALEQKIEEETSFHLDLAGEKAFSQKKSPFASVALLAAYIEGLLEEKAHA